MAPIHRTLASRAMRIHLTLFIALGIGFPVLDWAQGIDTEGRCLTSTGHTQPWLCDFPSW